MFWVFAFAKITIRTLKINPIEGEMAILVELLVDHSKDSIEARKLLYSLDRLYSEIEVEGIPANGDSLPIAFCGNFTYRGINRVRFLRNKLVRQAREGTI